MPAGANIKSEKVKVHLRIRPLNERERAHSLPIIVDAKTDRKFTTEDLIVINELKLA
jgi:hypothetical protein